MRNRRDRRKGTSILPSAGAWAYTLAYVASTVAAARTTYPTTVRIEHVPPRVDASSSAANAEVEMAVVVLVLGEGGLCIAFRFLFFFGSIRAR